MFKKNLSIKHILLLITVALLVFVSKLFYDKIYLRNERAIEIISKMKNLQLGMNKDQVIEIMDQPLLIKDYSIGGHGFIVMIYEEKFAASTIPQVVLCRENELVVEIIIEDTGKFNKRISSPNPCETIDSLYSNLKI